MARFEVGSNSDGGSETITDPTASSETAGEGGTGGNGECGEPCNDGESCVMGQCVALCEEPCDPTLEICDGGACVCRFGFTPCGGVCVDLRNNTMHCGDCDAACSVGLCEEGNCEPNGCQDSTECDGVCADLEQSALHCGGCNQACAGDEVCIEGECVGYQSIDCESDLDCSVGICCELEGLGSVCLDGDFCP